MSALFLLAPLVLAMTAYACLRVELLRAHTEDMDRDLYIARCDARALAIHLRAAEQDGARVDDRCRVALDDALAWCPASPNDRHRVRAGRCTLCGLGGLPANDSARGPR